MKKYFLLSLLIALSSCSMNNSFPKISTHEWSEIIDFVVRETHISETTISFLKLFPLGPDSADKDAVLSTNYNGSLDPNKKVTQHVDIDIDVGTPVSASYIRQYVQSINSTMGISPLMSSDDGLDRENYTYNWVYSLSQNHSSDTGSVSTYYSIYLNNYYSSFWLRAEFSFICRGNWAEII